MSRPVVLDYYYPSVPSQGPPPSWPPGPSDWNHGLYHSAAPGPAPGRSAHGPPNPFGPPTRRGPLPPDAHHLPPPRPPHPGHAAVSALPHPPHPPPASEPGTGFYKPRPRARPPPLNPYASAPPQHVQHPMHPPQMHASQPRALTPPMSVYSAQFPPHAAPYLDEEDDMEMEMEMEMEMPPPPPPFSAAGPAPTAYRTPTRAKFPPLTRSATEVPYRRPMSNYAAPERHAPPGLPGPSASVIGGAAAAYPPASGRPARRRYSASAYGYGAPDDASVYSAPAHALAPAQAPGYGKGFGREPRYPAVQSEYGGEMFAPIHFHSRHGSYSQEPPPAWEDGQYAPALGLGSGLVDPAYAPPQRPSAPPASAPLMGRMVTAPPLGRHPYTPPEEDPYAPPMVAPHRAITYAPAQTESRPRRNSSRSYPGFCTLPRAPNPNDSSSESDQTESEAESENLLREPSRPSSPADGPSKRRLIKGLGWSDRQTDEWLARQGEEFRSRKPQLQLTSKSSRHTSRHASRPATSRPATSRPATSRPATSRGRKSRPVSKAPTAQTGRSKSRYATPAPSRNQSKYRNAVASNYGEESRSSSRSQSESRSRSKSRAKFHSSTAPSRSTSKFRTPAASSYGTRSQSRGRSGYGVHVHARSRSRHGRKSRAASEVESESEAEEDTASESGSDTGSESEDEAPAQQSESENEAPKYHSFVYEGVEEDESQVEHGHPMAEPEIEEEDDDEEGYYDYGGDEHDGYAEAYDYHQSHYRRPGTGATRRPQPQHVNVRRGRR